MPYSQRMSSSARGSYFSLLLLQLQWFGKFLFCSFLQDFHSIHFLATYIKSLSIFLHANHYPLEWWSFEGLILLFGLLPNPELETSVLSLWYASFPYLLYEITIECF